MEYQKIINSLDNTPNELTKLEVKLRQSTKDGQIKFKSSMTKSRLCDYSDAYILVKGSISITAQAEDNPNNGNKEVIFKNCAPFTDCLSETNNAQIDNAKDIDVVMPMYSLIECSNNYLKLSGSLWYYYIDPPALSGAGALTNFSATDSSAWFKFKQKITGLKVANGRNNVETTMPLKYLSNLWKTLEMLSINCEINITLTWPIKECVI